MAKLNEFKQDETEGAGKYYEKIVIAFRQFTDLNADEPENQRMVAGVFVGDA